MSPTPYRVDIPVETISKLALEKFWAAGPGVSFGLLDGVLHIDEWCRETFGERLWGRICTMDSVIRNGGKFFYAFEYESDAVVFKLKWDCGD